MSLINEALKKAQPERPTAPNTPQPPPQQGEHYQPPRKRKRGYLWGFLMAVLIVGIFSAVVTTFLVYQILGENEGDPATVQTATESEATPGPETVWEKLPEAATEAPAEDTAIAGETGLAAAASGIADEVKPVASSEHVPEPVEEAVTQAPPARPSPAVWARLQELEIRGIMSGGNKVLIFDQSTGKTKSYEPGEIVDGSLALSVRSIESGEILFEDYGGSIHTKSF